MKTSRNHRRPLRHGLGLLAPPPHLPTPGAWSSRNVNFPEGLT